MEIIFNDDNGDRVMSIDIITIEEGGEPHIQIGHCEPSTYENVPLHEFEKALAFLKKQFNG